MQVWKDVGDAFRRAMQRQQRMDRPGIEVWWLEKQGKLPRLTPGQVRTLRQARESHPVFDG